MNKYQYTLEEDSIFFVPDVELTEFKNEWIEIDNMCVTVKAGYSWNGASPKFKLFGKTFGTWEGTVCPISGDTQLKYPTLLHDALYQFLGDLEPLGLDREFADKEFYTEMKHYKFKLAKPYYYAVRLFGWMFV